MLLYRQLLGIHSQDKRTNKSTLLNISIERSLIKETNKRTIRYISHAIKSQNRPYACSTDGQGCGKRGRPAMSLMDNIKTITGLSLDEVVHGSRDRESWKSVGAFIRGAAIVRGVVEG
ncbi:endonuclease-reverse transcriptase [Elysia marginata]|uniref:Endonuclease-reverse transcriptase n=1 Tax=Elysia marginata TaxID=1093978 RepID=A0AAV4FRX5_9GAST|nr:endonuclease-reverse transcriptase [Elysia marginata]